MAVSQGSPATLTQESPYEDTMEHHLHGREIDETLNNSEGYIGLLALEAIEPTNEGLGERPVEVPTGYDRVRHKRL